MSLSARALALQGIGFASALVALQGLGLVPANAAGGSGSKRRYLVQRGERLLVFASRRAASAELQAQEVLEELEELKGRSLDEPAVPAEALDAPPQQIDLAAVQAWAEWAGQLAAYQAAYQSRHFAALLALFEQMRDEDDVELLLLSL